jgi:hypothetical protein
MQTDQAEDNDYSHLANDYHLNRNDLFVEFDHELGHGAFSQVYRGNNVGVSGKKVFF